MNGRTILIQKTKKESVLKESETDFRIVVLDVSLPDIEAKGLQSNDYSDESGDDTFIPERLNEKGYDFHITVGYKGKVENWENDMDSFLDYITGYDGTGVEMLVYMCHHRIGRKCRMVKVTRPIPFINGGVAVVEFEIHFHVDSPRSRVELVKDLDNNVIALREKTR